MIDNRTERRYDNREDPFWTCPECEGERSHDDHPWSCVDCDASACEDCASDQGGGWLPVPSTEKRHALCESCASERVNRGGA